MINNTLEKIYKEICHEENIIIDYFCDSYCIKLSKGNKFTFIYDNVFENNPSSLYKILKDKSAVYEMLSKQNIPCIEHFYLYSKTGIDKEIENTLQNYLMVHKRLVIKHNEGMSGNYVFYVDDSNALISKSKILFKKFNSVCISPFYDFRHEYRVIVLNQDIKIIFDKKRPYIIGDGKNTIKYLATLKYGNQITPDKTINPQKIAKLNEHITLNWKHNLCYGAKPEIVSDKNLVSKISKLALDATKALKINFASIDIVQTQDNHLKILEINGSVSMGKFASFSEENYILAKEIYRQAIIDNLK